MWNDHIPIIVHACVNWNAFVEAVVAGAIPEFEVFLLDAKGRLDLDDVGKGAMRLIDAGARSFWLSGPRADELEWALDLQIVARRNVGELLFGGNGTVRTSTLPDRETTIIMIVCSDYLPEETGVLRSVIVGVFDEDGESAQSEGTSLTNELRQRLSETDDEPSDEMKR